MANEGRLSVVLASSLILIACGSSGQLNPTGSGGATAGGGSGGAGTATGGTVSDASGRGGGGGSARGGAGGAGGSAGGGAGGSAGGAGGGGGGTAAMVCDGFTIPADHRNGATAYDTTTAGVVIDPVTGLAWQRAAIADDPNWHSVGSCGRLTLGGQAGWRLPSVVELSSIVDYDAANPAIDTTAFPDTPATWFMTSTGVYLHGQLVGGVDWGHTIDFATGLTLNGMPSSGSIRCVRSITPRGCYPAGGRFTATSSGGVDAVADAATALTWQKAATPDMRTWSDAGAYCASLGGGFRLPGATELLSLVAWQAVGVAIDGAAFPDTPAAAFWTSSRRAGSATDAVVVDFSHADYAGTFSAPVDGGAYVRCVR